jgi:hypothetical protein
MFGLLVATVVPVTAQSFEVRGFGGFNYSPSRSAELTPRTPPSYGGEAAVLISETVAGIGTFGYNQGGGLPTMPGFETSIKELMFGVRLSRPIRDVPVTPYVSLLMGKAYFKQFIPTDKDILGVTHYVETSSSHLAFAIGVGADFNLNPHVGFGPELRAVKAMDVGWYRLCATLYFRFP